MRTLPDCGLAKWSPRSSRSAILGAEQDHQDYLEKRPSGYTCRYPRADWVLPKLQKAGNVQLAAAIAAR